jgi:4-amino-4-deoxy-L-arabinose transferase-like glycosyltransferase
MLVVVVWFATLPVRPLFNPDEGRYAEIPREMVAGGDWVVPHLNGLAYIEKPPLQYWATALVYRALGQSVFAARFYVAACALATLLVVGFTARRLWGVAAGWRAAAVLSSMALFVILGQLLTLDMSLTFYMTVSLAAFLLAQQPAHGAQARASVGGVATRWMMVAWLATALGVLTKGLVAAAIPVAVLVLYSLYTRDWGPWRRTGALWGLPLFLVITVPWHWLAARRTPEFLEFFFVREHLARYLTPSADRLEPGWFFAAVFLAGCIPWTVPALRALALGWRRPRVAAASPSRERGRGPFDARVFLWLWVAFVGVFFSLSDSKLIPYILPALPALALLMAAAPSSTWRRDTSITAVIGLGAAIAAVVAALWGPKFLPATARGQCFALLARPLLEAAALLAVSGAIVLANRRREPTRDAVILGAGWCLAMLSLLAGAKAVAPIYSGATLAAATLDDAASAGATVAGATGALAPVAPIYSVQMYDQTLPFYWDRTVELVSYRGELDYGLKLNPAAEIPDLEQFVLEWRAAPEGYAIMEKKLFRNLTDQGVPMREITQDVNRVVVARQ